MGVKIQRNKNQRIQENQKLSQRGFADKQQIMGLDIDKNTIQRMESGQRFITDIELIKISKASGVGLDVLFDQSIN